MTEKIPILVIIFLVIIVIFHRQNVERNFFSPEYDNDAIILGYGTGFYINENHIITNNHVIDGCKNIITQNGLLINKLTVVASDELNDLAVLKTNKSVNYYANIANYNLEKNDKVHILGYPGGSYKYKIADIINADAQVPVGPPQFSKKFEQRKIIFTDSVRPGNSGGPVIDQQGNLVGVVDSYTKMTFRNLD